MDPDFQIRQDMTNEKSQCSLSRSMSYFILFKKHTDRTKPFTSLLSFIVEQILLVYDTNF